MSKDLKFENDLLNAISAVMEKNHKTGEINLLNPDGSVRINLVGQPSAADLLINLEIEELKEEE